MEDVIWKPVVGFEGSYEVSNLGEIRSVARISSYHDPRWNTTVTRAYKSCIIKQNNVSGYKFIGLYKGGKLYQFYVHRLVAQAFIPNPENKPEVNHIDGDKSNNHVSNLEWCTRIENQHHAMINGLTPSGQHFHMKKMSDAALKKNCKPILCVNSNVKYPSRQAAARALNLNANYILNSIRTGKSYKGYLFMEAIDG